MNSCPAGSVFNTLDALSVLRCIYRVSTLQFISSNTFKEDTNCSHLWLQQKEVTWVFSDWTVKCVS